MQAVCQLIILNFLIENHKNLLQISYLQPSVTTRFVVFFEGLDFTISAKFTKIDWLCLQAWPVATGVDAQKSIASGVARSLCSYYILFLFWPRIAENTWPKDNLNILRESFEHHPETHLLNHPMTFGALGWGFHPETSNNPRPRMSQQITWTWMLCRGGPRKNTEKTKGPGIGKGCHWVWQFSGNQVKFDKWCFVSLNS